MTITMWDAMVEGAKRGRQLFAEFYNGDGGSCAVGAMAYGCGIRQDEITRWPSLSELLKIFPELHNETLCPICGVLDSNFELNRKMTLLEVIMHLNDRHNWKRESIAEWLKKSYEVKDVKSEVNSKEFVNV